MRPSLYSVWFALIMACSLTSSASAEPLPAEIITGNSLTVKYSRVLRTPAYYLHGWPARLESNEKSVVAY